MPKKKQAFIMMVFTMFILVFSGLTLASSADLDDPFVNLTWEDSPQTTQTITWVVPKETEAYNLVYYGKYDGEWEKINDHEPESYTIDSQVFNTDNGIYSVKIENLNPDSDYLAQIKYEDDIVDEFMFSTLPESGELNFVVGADSRTDESEPRQERRKMRRKINSMVARENPDFVVFGGDLIDNPDSDSHWNWWLEDWDELMITEDNRRIPIVPAIGNHEVMGGYYGEKEDAKFYYNYFNLPGNEKYYSLELNEDVLLITLDSAHTTRIEEQEDWLEETLKNNYNEYETILVQYHLAAWPSRRDFYQINFRRIREYWVPLFEEYDVDVVFEAHDHTFKLSEPITISEITDQVRYDVNYAMEKAEENFDVEKDYTPWGNPLLQKLSAGDWEQAAAEEEPEIVDDLDTLDNAFREMVYHIALYQKQSENFTKRNILNETVESELYPKFWDEKIDTLGRENLTNYEEGVLYIGDGGWGAPLRYPHDAEETWYLRRAVEVFNYFNVSIGPGGDKVNLEPVFIPNLLELEVSPEGVRYKPELWK